MKNILFPVLTVMLFALVSCKKAKHDPPVDQPPPPANEEEIITTFLLTLQDSASGLAKTYKFADPDGDGGAPAFYGPTKETQSDSVIALSAHSTYYGTIVLLNETAAPPDTISREVDEEGDEHMIFYNPATASVVSQSPLTLLLPAPQISITYNDLDDGSPQRAIGLHTRWRTNGPSQNARYPLEIILKHQPGVKDGTYPPGETDVSVGFRIQVE